MSKPVQIAEIMELTGLDRRTILHYCNAGLIPGARQYKKYGKWYFDLDRAIVWAMSREKPCRSTSAGKVIGFASGLGARKSGFLLRQELKEKLKNMRSASATDTTGSPEAMRPA